MQRRVAGYRKQMVTMKSTAIYPTIKIQDFGHFQNRICYLYKPPGSFKTGMNYNKQKEERTKCCNTRLNVMISEFELGPNISPFPSANWMLCII